MKFLVKDAAQVLKVGEDMVRKLERQGKLTAERTKSGTRIFESDDVHRLAKERAASKKKR